MIISDSFRIFVLRLPGGLSHRLLSCRSSTCGKQLESASETDEIGTFGMTIIDALNDLGI